SSRRRHTRSKRDWSSDVCSSDLGRADIAGGCGRRDRRLAAYPIGAASVSERGTGRIYLEIWSGLAQMKLTIEITGDLEAALKTRSEERRVGKECRSRWWREH